MGCTSCSQHADRPIPADLLEKTKKHPCYSFEAHQKYARMHLPVAPGCNISCNYCNRKFDCVNESRPGVTSEVLTPTLAKEKFDWVKSKLDHLSVVGIAGPGDALANWEQTKRSVALIKADNPDIVFCLSTNGLLLPDYAEEIIRLGVQHVTVTMNCIDPEIGAKIYKFVRYQGHKYQGVEGAKLLLGRQLEGIAKLTAGGVLVKVNIVMVSGINDRHIPQVVKKAKELGAFMTNIMPLIPAQGSAFEHFPQTSMKDIEQMRQTCELDLTQMHHCKQCRADAIGLLEYDQSQEFRMSLQPPADRKVETGAAGRRYMIAVTSQYGKLVDQHFGHAEQFAIYQGRGEHFAFLEYRKVKKYCTGMIDCDDEEARREGTLKALKDCDAVLTMRIGLNAKRQLADRGIDSIEYCDTVETGLVYAAQQLAQKKMEERKEKTG